MKIIKFLTKSGSLYEVDAIEKKIRRVSNTNNSQPTDRQTDSWKEYSNITDIVVGQSVLICWDKNTTPIFDGSPDHAVPSTMTSPVVEIS